MWLWINRRLNKGNLFLLLGSAGFLNEVFLHEGAERPFVLAASLAFAGLKLTLPMDERKRGDDS